MNIGIIGLGNIGTAVACRLITAGYTVFGHDTNQVALKRAATKGIHAVPELKALANKSSLLWIFVPAGPIIDSILKEVSEVLKPGAIIIDGGNSHFKDSQRRAQELLQKSINFLDCGTSGGLQGKELGFCLMVGGNKEIYQQVVPVFTAVAMPDGFNHVGPYGAGHYVKMVHNGIEYGLLQAYAEGINLLKEASYKKELNLEKITQLWQHGSIIRSWLLQLTTQVLETHPDFDCMSGAVGQLGTGRWAVEEAEKNNVPVPVIQSAIQVRDQSQKTGGNFTTKLIALVRNKFGAHPFTKSC